MKRRNTTPKFIARKTVLFTVIGCVVLGLASLLVGLQMHRDSLLEASMRVNRMTAARAAVVAQKAADTVGLAGDVMGVYRNLTPEQRSRTGTEEYRQYFRALESAGSPGRTSAVLTYKLRNYAQDVSALYLCALDREGNALVCLADTDGVPEANNAAKEMFGEKRLLETLNENPGAEPEELIRKVREAVDCFAGGAPQFDDITMLCFEYKRGL